MPLNKITLKSTSRISLNDRFTSLRGMGDVADGIEERRQVVQASRKNMRLAQQMEHRPTVIAALGSVQQRGGLRGRGRGVMRGRGQVRGRGLLQGARGAARGSLSGSRGALSGARGAGRTIRGGSIRGINFRTGAPIISRVAGVRDVSTADVPVKRRLAVQGRLSQPPSSFPRGRGAWASARGAFKTVQTNFIRGTAARGGVRGRGSFRARGILRGRGRGAGVSAVRGSFQTRTFRGRGRGGRGGYSQQWGGNN